MKATGIVRRIDDLGRVIIPKEIRNTLNIREGDALEIYLNEEGGVVFQKYIKSAEEKATFAQRWLEDNAKFINQAFAKFSIENRIVMCEIVYNNKRMTGTAKAASGETFIPAVGMVIAYCRAKGLEPPKELEE